MANNQVVVYLLLNAAQYNAAMAQATGQAQNLGKTANTAGGQAASGLGQATSASTGLLGTLQKVLSTAALMAVRFAGMYVAVAALKNIVGAGIDEFVKLDTNLRNVQSITLDSDRSIDKLRHTLLDSVIAGSTFGRSASELAEGMYELVSAGYSTDEAFALVKIAAMGAAAGLSDTATVSKLLLGILQAYKLPVSEAAGVMDQLFTIVDLGVVHFDQLASTMGLVIPTAAALKIPINEVGAAIELLTRQGQQPSRVMTNLNDVMTKLLKPNHALSAAIDELGFKSGEAMVKTLGFAESIRRLSILAGGSDATLAAWFSDIRAIRGILPLAADEGRDFTEMLREHNKEMEGASRTALALAEQQKSMSYQWSVLSAKLRAVVGLTVGELTPAVAGLLRTMNSGIETITNIVGAITSSADAMTVLKGVILALIATQILPKLILLLETTAIRFLLFSGPGQAVAFAMMGQWSKAFQMLGLSLQKVAIVAILTALYTAMQKLAATSSVNKTLDGFRTGVEQLEDTLAKAKDAMGKGELGEKAFGIFAEEQTFRSVINRMDEFEGEVTKLGTSGLGNLGDFAAFAKDKFMTLFGLLGASDWRSNLDKLKDGIKQTLIDTVGQIGNNKQGLITLSEDLRRLIENRSKDIAASQEQMLRSKDFSVQAVAGYSAQTQAQRETVKALEDGYSAVQRQLQGVIDTEGAHRKAAIAAKETTEQILSANDRVMEMAKSATTWANNLKPVEETVKKIGELLTPQKAAAEANIASIELQIAEYEHLHQANKEANDAEIAGLEKAKSARKLANDTMDAAIKQQERSLDKQKEVITQYDKQIALLEKQKDAFKTPMNERLRDLQEQLTILKAQQQVMEDSHQNTSGIKKQIADLEKQINVQTVGALKEDAAHRKADQAIDGQIKKQKELKEKAEATVKAEQDRINKLKEQFDIQKENNRLEDDKSAQRIQDLKDMSAAQDPVLANMKSQLQAAKETESLEAARLKSLQAQAIASAMTNLKEQGMTLDLSEQKFLLEAIPAIMYGNVGAVQQLADKYGVSTERADELLGKALTLGQTNGTPKFDPNAPKPLADATGNVFEKMLTINRTPVVVKVNDGQIDTLVGKIGALAATLSKGFKAAVHWVVDRMPHNAMGGIYSKHMVTEIAEGDKAEAVIPLTNPSRAKAILGAINPAVLGSIMPRSFVSGMGIPADYSGGGMFAAKGGGGGGNMMTKLADSINLTAPSVDEIMQQLQGKLDDLGSQLRLREQRRGSVLNGRLM